MPEPRITKHLSSLLAEQAGVKESAEPYKEALARAFTEIDYLEGVVIAVNGCLEENDPKFAQRILKNSIEGIKDRTEAAKNAKH